MPTIPLTKGFSAEVSRVDYPRLNAYRWHALTSNTGPVYAARHEPGNHGHIILMHRGVLGVSAKAKVDHRNGNSLDNTRRNLRRATDMQNQRGFLTPRTGKTSIYRGVSRDQHRGKWKAQISVCRRVLNLGRFGTPEAAALAYNRAALKFFGSFAQPNQIKRN